MRFQIGQEVYRASWESQKAYITCPDCGGTGRLRVTFHDETQVSVECRRCQSGYDPPSGVLPVYDRTPQVVLTTITGVEVEHGELQWRTADCWRAPDENLFNNKASCLLRAADLAEQASREEREQIAKKEKDTRSWAWNAHYHRECIRRAQRDIEYHTAKLNVASLKAKKEKKA